MRKTELLAFLQNQTDFFDPDNLSEVFTASWLARRFAMQRNTASHYLNQLVAQDVLVKIRCPQPGQKLPRVKGLAQVIVCTGIQAVHPVIDAGQGRQH